jgi:hypothetical protein
MDEMRSGLRLAELLAALSVVIDVGMRRPAGEAVRICLVATSLGRALGLGASEVRDVFYTGLLQDLGCGPVIVDYVLSDGEEPVEHVFDEEFFRASCEVGAMLADRLQLGRDVRNSLHSVLSVGMAGVAHHAAPAMRSRYPSALRGWRLTRRCWHGREARTL